MDGILATSNTKYQTTWTCTYFEDAKSGFEEAEHRALLAQNPSRLLLPKPDLRRLKVLVYHMGKW